MLKLHIKKELIIVEHSQIILNVIAEKNISAYKIAKNTGISESLFSKWKINPTSDISSNNLCKIADYLDCSVDYLLGRTDVPEVNKKESNVINIAPKKEFVGEVAAFGGGTISKPKKKKTQHT